MVAVNPVVEGRLDVAYKLEPDEVLDIYFAADQLKGSANLVQEQLDPAQISKVLAATTLPDPFDAFGEVVVGQRMVRQNASETLRKKALQLGGRDLRQMEFQREEFFYKRRGFLLWPRLLQHYRDLFFVELAEEGNVREPVGASKDLKHRFQFLGLNPIKIVKDDQHPVTNLRDAVHQSVDPPFLRWFGYDVFKSLRPRNGTKECARIPSSVCAQTRDYELRLDLGNDAV